MILLPVITSGHPGAEIVRQWVRPLPITPAPGIYQVKPVPQGKQRNTVRVLGSLAPLGQAVELQPPGWVEWPQWRFWQCGVAVLVSRVCIFRFVLLCFQ